MVKIHLCKNKGGTAEMSSSLLGWGVIFLSQSECVRTRYGLIQSLFPVTSLKLLKYDSIPASFALLQKKLPSIKLRRTWNVRVCVHFGFYLAKVYWRISRQKNTKGAWNRTFKAYLVRIHSLSTLPYHIYFERKN